MGKGCTMEDVASWAVVGVACAGSLGFVTQEAGKPHKAKTVERR